MTEEPLSISAQGAKIPTEQTADAPTYIRDHDALRALAKAFEHGEFPISGAEVLRLLEGIEKPASAWRPIKTAPKDGRGFLVTCPHVTDGVSLMTYESGRLVSLFDGKPWLSSFAKPTHWMPLPKGPNE